jgi:hypothetical protein
MRRPKLVACHVAMTLTYPVIIWAYAAGWTRLGGLDGRLRHLPGDPGRVRGDPGRGVGIEREARPLPRVAKASVRAMVGRGC